MKKIVMLSLILAGCSGSLGSSLGKRPEQRGLTEGAKISRDLVSINTVKIAPINCQSANCPNSTVIASLTDDLVEAFMRQTSIETAKNSADAVLITSLSNYEERQGSAAGASKPAVVNFTMRLVRNGDNRELWNAIYHFKDQALTDNLLSIQNRVNDSGQMGWKSAREIAQGAFSAAFKSLDAKRTAQFTTSASYKKP